MLYKRNFFRKVCFSLLLVSIIFGTFVGCSKEDSANLDGTWKNGIYSIVIKGSNYTSKVNDVNWGKGIITYSIADGTYSLKSTHAWHKDDSNWNPFEETCNGIFTYNNNKISFATVDNMRYEAWTVGIWTRN